MVTRVEVAEAIGASFEAGGGCRRFELVAAARASGAGAEVLAALNGLSDRRFQQLSDLWSELGHLPVEPGDGAR